MEATKLKTVSLIATLIIVVAVFSVAWSAPTQMPSGFYYPTDRTTWTGTNGGAVGDPKQPWNDASPGGRIYGFLEISASGPWVGKTHVGMDIRTPYGSPVYAIADGTVLYYVTSDGPRYECVIVQHQEATGKLFWAVYGHCRLAPGLAEGSSVRAGDIIAHVNENVNQHMHMGVKMDLNFDTGWGYLAAGLDPDANGWRGARTWLSSHAPFNGTPQPDTIPPYIRVTGPTVNTRYTTLQQVKWSVFDDESGVNQVTLQWDSDDPIEVGPSGSTIIPNGTHTLTIVATDVAGNSSTATSGPYILSVPNMIVSVPPGVLTEGYFIQKSDKTSGILVDPSTSSPLNLALGDTVTIDGGTLVTLNGGTVLQNGSIGRVAAGTAPQPRSLSVQSIRSGYSGLLVSVTGTVSYRSPDGSAFYVDDGSHLSDGYHTGIRVLCNGFTNGSVLVMPTLGRKVTVAGIRWTVNIGTVVPAIQPRGQTDITLR